MALTNGMSKVDSPPAGQLIIKANVGEDIRRIPIHNDDLTYDELILMMQRVFKGVLNADDDFELKYKDEDGDLVSLVDTNDLSYAIQNSRVLRLTILHGGDSGRGASVVNKDVVKELRQIRDKVNQLLDSITGAEQVSKMFTEEDQKKDNTVEEITESVNHLNLEQSKEFDPLAGQDQQQKAVESSASPIVDNSEKTRQMSGQSSVSSGSGQTQQYPGNYPGYSSHASSTGYQQQHVPQPQTPQTYAARPAYPGAAPPPSPGFQASGPPSSATSNYPPAAAPSSAPSFPPASSTPGYPTVAPPSGAPANYPPGPPASFSASSFTASSNTTDSSQAQATTSYAPTSATSSGYPQQQPGYPPSSAPASTGFPGYPGQPVQQPYQHQQPGQTVGAGGVYPPGNYGAANPYSRVQPGQGYPRPPQ